MSRFADPTTGDDHPDAAAKHLDDADALLKADRFDGAAYHAGYVIECAIKSLLLVERGAPPLPRSLWHHRLAALSHEALRLAVLPNARSARYARGLDAAHPLYDNQRGWSETLRYKASRHVSEQTARDWFSEAERTYEATVARMRLDGVV